MYATTTSRRAALAVTLLALLGTTLALGMLFSAAAGAQSYSLVENSTHNVSDDQTVSVDVEFGDGWFNETDSTNASTSAKVEIRDNSTGDLLANETVSVNETEYGAGVVAITKTATFNSSQLEITSETNVSVEVLAEDVSAVQLSTVTVEDADTSAGGGGGILPPRSSLPPLHLVFVVALFIGGTAAIAARGQR